MKTFATILVVLLILVALCVDWACGNLPAQMPETDE